MKNWLINILASFVSLPDVFKKIGEARAESRHRGIIEELDQNLKIGIEGRSSIQYEGHTETATVKFSGTYIVIISKNGEPKDAILFNTIYELDNYLTNNTRFRVGDFI